jgi:hypothetical protein
MYIHIYVYIHIFIYIYTYIYMYVGIHLPGDIAFGTPFASIDNGLAGLFGPHAVPQQVDIKVFVLKFLQS